MISTEAYQESCCEVSATGPVPNAKWTLTNVTVTFGQAPLELMTFAMAFVDSSQTVYFDFLIRA